MSDNLTFLAGKKALTIIKEKGLRPDLVRVMAGAAGGPRWLVLSRLDQAIFATWFKDRHEPLFLLGSSIGAWRFAAACQRDPFAAFERFQAAYLDQYYTDHPSPQEVLCKNDKILTTLLGATGRQEILQHPYLRLNIMTVRCMWPVASDTKALLTLGLMQAYLYNYVYRGALRFFFERALFYDPRDLPPFLGMRGFPMHRIALDCKNLHKALLASSAVPMLLPGVKNIPGAPTGVYRDGGHLDYHFDIPFIQDEGIVLFPHFMGHLIPGWFDKKLVWRKPSRSNLANVVLICPSSQFIARLPYKKIPDRHDFRRFRGRDKDRVAYWQTVIKAGEQLANEFLEVAESGKIRDLIKPIR